MSTLEKSNRLNTLIKQTIELIKKGSRRESLIMANVTIIESLEFQLNIPQENRISNKRIFNGY